MVQASPKKGMEIHARHHSGLPHPLFLYLTLQKGKEITFGVPEIVL